MATQHWNFDQQQPKRGHIRSSNQTEPKGESAPLRIVLADDHAIVLEGLRLSLESAGMEIVGVAHSGQQALELVEQQPVDLLLTDLNMPAMNGLQLSRLIRQAQLLCKIVILTGDGNRKALAEAKSLQVDGFLSKDLSSRNLAEAISRIAAGERVYQISDDQPLTEFEGQGGHKEPQLSDQELEVLRLLAQALDNREIASVLVISENTVKSHVSSILSKLGVANRTQAALWALSYQSGTFAK